MNSSDSVVRTQYYKYFHPKESMVGGGIACASMCKTLLEQNISTIPYDFSDERLKIQVSLFEPRSPPQVFLNNKIFSLEFECSSSIHMEQR